MIPVCYTRKHLLRRQLLIVKTKHVNYVNNIHNCVKK